MTNDIYNYTKNVIICFDDLNCFCYSCHYPLAAVIVYILAMATAISSTLMTHLLRRIYYEWLASRLFCLLNSFPQVTPIYAPDQWGSIDWMHYLCLWEQLPVDMKRVAELVGVQERYLARAVRSGGSGPRQQTAGQAHTAAVHRRFYVSMALHDLANEMPLGEVVRKYGCTRGVLQSLQQSAATFAGMSVVLKGN